MYGRKNNDTHLKKCSSGDLKSYTFSADDLIWITGQPSCWLDTISSGPLEAEGRPSLKTDSKAWALCRKSSPGRGGWKGILESIEWNLCMSATFSAAGKIRMLRWHSSMRETCHLSCCSRVFATTSESIAGESRVLPPLPCCEMGARADTFLLACRKTQLVTFQQERETASHGAGWVQLY